MSTLIWYNMLYKGTSLSQSLPRLSLFAVVTKNPNKYITLYYIIIMAHICIQITFLEPANAVVDKTIHYTEAHNIHM